MNSIFCLHTFYVLALAFQSEALGLQVGLCEHIPVQPRAEPARAAPRGLAPARAEP